MTDGKTASLKVLGQRVHWARERLGLTLRDLRRRTRMSLGYLSDIERNVKVPSLEKLLTLAAALGVRVGFLLGEVDFPEYPPPPVRATRTIAIHEVF